MSIFGRSQVRERILLEFFRKPGTKAHVREMARRVGAAPATVGAELGNLERLGLLHTETVGRSLVYSIDERSKLIPEVRSLVQKTLGTEALINQSLSSLPGVESAYLFGSYASGKERRDSDIDLLIVGRPDRLALSERLAPVERALGREVNVVVRTKSELTRRSRADAFWRRVLSGRLVHVAGQEISF